MTTHAQKATAPFFLQNILCITDTGTFLEVFMYQRLNSFKKDKKVY
jgi:hypothetical protein